MPSSFSKLIKSRKLFIHFLLISVLVAISILLFYRQILQAIGNYLLFEDDLRPVDVIHVIAGEDYRTEYAIELYKRGFARYIFFTGGWCKFHGYYHGQHGRELALSRGVPPEAILIDDAEVKSTFDETLLLKSWLQNNSGKIYSVIVVSDPHHMRRSRWTIHFILGQNFTALMAPVPFEHTPFIADWWKDSASLSYVREEYTKLVYYILRYQFSFTWLAFLDQE